MIAGVLHQYAVVKNIFDYNRGFWSILMIREIR